MICRSNEGKRLPKPQMFGGEGTAQLREIFAKGDYLGHARLMGVLTLAPGCSVGEHTHQNDEELVYILKGSCVYYDNAEKHVLGVGDAALTRGGESHRIVNESEELVEYLAVVLTY